MDVDRSGVKLREGFTSHILLYSLFCKPCLLQDIEAGIIKGALNLLAVIGGSFQVGIYCKFHINYRGGYKVKKLMCQNRE